MNWEVVSKIDLSLNARFNQTNINLDGLAANIREQNQITKINHDQIE
jgi:hypothetical protein